jgi:hypothetical protein
MARLEQVDEAEADPIDGHGAGLIDTGQERARCHEGNLGRRLKRGQGRAAPGPVLF